MAGGIEHDAQPGEVAALGLVLGLDRPTLDRPGDTGFEVLDPEVEVQLHALRTRAAGIHRPYEVLLELNLDLASAGSVRGPEHGPTVSGRVSRPRTDDLLDRPAQEFLVEASELGDVRSVEDGARHPHRRPLRFELFAHGDEPMAVTDLHLGAFTDRGPWTVDPDAMTWRRGLDRVRTATAAEVPSLTRRRWLPPGGRVVTVGWRLGKAMAQWYVGARRTGDQSASRTDLSQRLQQAFEKNGPTYIKLGQILSSGEGIFPEELVSEFKKLRDKVRAESFETVRAVVERDLGRPLEEVFTSFERTPIAAASIAQVHAATLKTGESVVVKVQRPQVASLVRRDIAAMSWIAPVLVGRIPISALANPPALVELFAETIVEELDFRLEAENMLDIARILAKSNERAIVVPRPHPELVTRRVLVMERLDGFSFDDVAGMKAAGIDTSAVVRASMVAFLEGAVLYGVFHGDLHGGNLFVMEDGRVALLDYGITGRLSEPRRLAFLRLLMGGTSNDVRVQLAALRDLGALPPETDLEQIIVDLKLEGGDVIDPTQMSPDELMAQIREITKALLGIGARMPKELMLFVKDMLFLDGALGKLAPDVDLFAEITHIATYFATQHGERIAKDVGFAPELDKINLDGMRASFGLKEDVTTITHRELQERRAIIRKRMEEHRRKR
jgi:ubiquinone biosynthesis protein